MNGYLKKIIPIKFLIFFQIYSYIISLSCNNYSFCFECISDNSCTWDSNSCQNISQLKNKKPYITTNISPKKCFEQKDNKSLNYIQKNCGKTSYNFLDNGQSLSISLPKHNNSLYGTNKLYCEYTVYNKDSIKALTIQTSKKWGSLKMHVKYFYSNQINEIILGNQDKNIILNSEVLKIIFESNIEKDISPFVVSISNALSSLNKYIITLIAFCSVLGIITIIILLIIWCKRRKKIVINNNINNLNNIYINNINFINDMSTERIGLMEYLNRIKPVKFKEITKNKKGIKNMKCPIDLENFQQDSDVILTECLHLFHYDCLKTFVEKNKKLKEFKCPLCNHILYSTKITEENEFNNGNQNFPK